MLFFRGVQICKSDRVVALVSILFALKYLGLSQPFFWRIKSCGVLLVQYVPTFRRMAVLLSAGSGAFLGPFDPEVEGTAIVLTVDLPSDTP
jgi:hypothetical protein